MSPPDPKLHFRLLVFQHALADGEKRATFAVKELQGHDRDVKISILEVRMIFERLVFWSGVWNVGLGLILITPPVREFLGLQVPNPFWPSIVAAFLWYTSATLILSSRDVRIFASVVYWEALLRFAAVGLLVAYGVTYVGVIPTILFAITDFVWGLFYIVGLRRLTGRSHASLLFDRDV